VETEAALPPKPTPPWRRVAQRVADRLAARVRAVRAAMTNRLSQNEDRAPDLKSAWPGLGAFELRKIYPPQRYGAKAVEAVQNLTFSVAPGEVFGLLGANGAGKSTSISMIVRAVEPHSGHATVSGKSVLDDFAGASRGLGVVNQHNTLWDDLSCLDHLIFFAALRTKVGHERIALTTLAQLELSHHAHKMAGRLSGAVWESNCRVASPPLLNRDLHAIYATQARWRGVVVHTARFSHHGRVLAEKGFVKN
jgi:ABC-type glutathione transport system ATPase component